MRKPPPTNGAAISARSPPPCGEGLGVGAVVGGRISRNNYDPPPRPCPSRLRACPLPAILSVTKPRQAGVWLEEGAHRVCRLHRYHFTGLPSNSVRQLSHARQHEAIDIGRAFHVAEVLERLGERAH